jgi:hypothetical protein
LRPTCSVINDRDTCCEKALCLDTEPWTTCADIDNPTNGCGCRDRGFSLTQGCTLQGWTCRAYEIWGWCVPTVISRGRPFPGKEDTLARPFNFPEVNCCICGGGTEVLPTFEWWTPTIAPPHELVANPPAQHVCCSAVSQQSRAGVQAAVPKTLNHTAMEHLDCSVDRPADSKQGAACTYCLCLFDLGADLYARPQCCSLNDLADRRGEPGLDPRTGFEYCGRSTAQQSLPKQKVAFCELRYDLYSYTNGASGPIGMSWSITILASISLASTMSVR